MHSECRKRQLQWGNAPNDAAIAPIRSDYADHLTLLDHKLRQLISNLSKPQRTVITIVSDHGELLGDAGFLYKSCFLEGAVCSLAIHHHSDHWTRARLWQKPVGLSWFLAAAASDVSGTRRFRASLPPPPFIFSELGDELLVSDRYRKLFINTSGELLWAVDLKSDPTEQINLLQKFSVLLDLWQVMYQASLDHLSS